MTLLSHSSILEILQTLAAAVGVGFNIWVLRRAVGDYCWLKANKFNGPRLFWARASVVHETLMLALQLLFLAMGLVSLYYPPPYAPTEVVLLPWPVIVDLLDLPPIQAAMRATEIRSVLLLVATLLVTIKKIAYWRDREVLINTDWKPEPWDGKDRRGCDTK